MADGRVLILAGAGMLGHRLLLALRGEWNVWTTVRRPLRAYERYGIFARDTTIDGVDVTDIQSVIDAMAVVRPNVVVNCAGVIKQLPGAQDRLLSLTMNSVLPHRLQRLCQAAGARLIHFSTDCVFSGRKGMYTEDDPSDATDVYGRTKFLGETAGDGALTIRTSIIGRELETCSGLVEWFLSQRGGRVSGYTRAIYTGFTTHALARILSMVLRDHPELSGTVQVASEPIAKHDLLLLLRDAYHADVEIVPDDRVEIDRSLDGSRFRRITGFVPPSWPAMIDEMAADPTPYDDWRADVHG
jgi:dTDP-4-dehydrorhamnose reductase